MIYKDKSKYQAVITLVSAENGVYIRKFFKITIISDWIVLFRLIRLDYVILTPIFLL